ncbi:hypothetical protein L3N51_01763 [Metallosphaera sp. J1]|nr:hypothetical protein [Metallosphaera javensis (ex Hofmann et al. 2022)]
MLRQAFGFYMEELVAKTLESRGEICLPYDHNQIYSWKRDGLDTAVNALISFFDVLSRNEVPPYLDVKHHYSEVVSTIKAIIYGFEEGRWYDLKLWSILKDRYISTVLDPLDPINVKLFVISNLVQRNIFELLRVRSDKVIVSEVKSQFGPRVDYKIEIENRQFELMKVLYRLGLNYSLIYLIALPRPRFVEIYLKDILSVALEKDKTRQSYRIRVRVPVTYRDEKKFQYIDSNLYKYNDEVTLLEELEDRYRRRPR